jgi:hypothetical protein
MGTHTYHHSSYTCEGADIELNPKMKGEYTTENFCPECGKRLSFSFKDGEPTDGKKYT